MKTLNKISTKLFFLLTFVLLANGSIFAQTKKVVPPKKTIEPKKVVEVVKPAERPVTVVLKEGELFKRNIC